MRRTKLVAAGVFLTATVASARPDWSTMFLHDPDIFGPPYPTPYLHWDILNTVNQGGGLVPTEKLGIRIGDVVPAIPTHGTGGDNGGGGPGPAGNMDIYIDAIPPQNSFFDIFFELDLPNGLPLHGGHIASATFAPSFFDVFVDIDVPGVGIQTHHVHGTPGQAGAVFGPGTHATYGDSFFDVFVELDVFGPYFPTSPAIVTTMTGTSPTPGGMVLLALAGLGAARRRR